MNEVPSTQTQTDRQAEALRLGNAIASLKQQIDPLDVNVKELAASQTDLMASVERLKAEEARLLTEHESLIGQRKEEVENTESTISGLKEKYSEWQSKNCEQVNLHTELEEKITLATENLVALEKQSKVLSEGNHPLIVEAEAKLTSLNEQITKARTMLEGFILQRAELNRDFEARHEAVVREEKRMEEKRKQYEELRARTRKDFPDQHVDL